MRFSFLEPACETHTAFLYLPFISRTGEFSKSYSTSELQHRTDSSTPKHLREPPPSEGQGSARGRLGAVRGTRTGAARPGGMAHTRVGRPPAPAASHSRSLERLLGEGSRALLLLEGAQRLEGLRQLLHGGHVRSARAGGTGPRCNPPCHGRLAGPSAVPQPLALPPGSLPALCRRSRGPGPVTAAMNGAGAARGRRCLPSAPPPSWIRPVAPRARTPPPGLPRPSRSGAPARGSVAHAHSAPRPGVPRAFT